MEKEVYKHLGGSIFGELEQMDLKFRAVDCVVQLQDMHAP